jgi:hypothetical protein
MALSMEVKEMFIVECFFADLARLVRLKVRVECGLWHVSKVARWSYV